MAMGQVPDLVQFSGQRSPAEGLGWVTNPTVTAKPTKKPVLTSHQMAAIEDAIRRAAWARHPVHYSLSVPLFRGRYYIAFVAGPDKRSNPRPPEEPKRHFRPELEVLMLAVVMTIGGFLGIETTRWLADFFLLP